jgi:anti-sigma regulatory factor (Ser/Thr protein kinase)
LSDCCIRIQEPTDSSEARRCALSLAAGLSFDEVSAGNLGLVVTEAAKNLLKHAGGGNIILRLLAGGGDGIEMLALDKGPGIADPGRCFQDGYSTAGTSGNGLGAIARLSNFHQIYSRPGQGTVLLAQVWRRGSNGQGANGHTRFGVGGVCVPVAGEEDCGDDWVFQEKARGARITVADGLGHGPAAADASRAAVRTAREQINDSSPALLERIHGALRSTRGAAVAVAEIDPEARVLRFAGIGNISAAVVPRSGPIRRLASGAGTAGHQYRKILEFSCPWEPGSLLLMHSDGLQTQWSFDPYPGLLERHPSVIAGVFYRDYARSRDDVTVVVAREEWTAA